MKRAQWPLSGSRYQRYQFEKDIVRAVQELTTDNWHAAVYWIGDVLVIALSIAGCYQVSWLLYPLAVVLISTRQRALLAILHDSAHGCAARHHLLNRLLGTFLTAYPLFFTFTGYRAMHVLTHHPYLGDPQRDPDLQFFISQGVYDRTSSKEYLKKMILFPLLGSRTLFYIRYLICRAGKAISRLIRRETAMPTMTNNKLDTNRPDKRSLVLFWLTVLSACGYAGFIDEVFLFWLIPYLTLFQSLCWFIELAEHTPMMQSETVDLYMTRNRKSRGWEGFFFAIHNENYHLDHHLNTNVPFWRLPESRRIRLLDSEYARVDTAMGGIFIRGTNGVTSSVAAILSEVASRSEVGLCVAKSK